MTIIQEAVEKHLEGIISPAELYSTERKIAIPIIHEIVKVEIELAAGSIISIYDIEKFVYDEGSDCGFIIRADNKADSDPAEPGRPKWYSIWYNRPFVEALDTLKYENGRRCDGTKVDIKEVRVLSKKDATIAELMKRYETFNTNDIFDDTLEFQLKYGLLEPRDDYKFMPPEFLPEENMLMKIGHLQEELDEIKKAYENRDLPETADRLMDLIYVAAGLCNLMHLPSYYLWNDVQNSNMAFKERVTSLDNATKRGSTFDVRKTARWIAPRGAELIKEWTEQGEESDKVDDKLAETLKALKS